MYVAKNWALDAFDSAPCNYLEKNFMKPIIWEMCSSDHHMMIFHIVNFRQQLIINQCIDFNLHMFINITSKFWFDWINMDRVLVLKLLHIHTVCLLLSHTLMALYNIIIPYPILYHNAINIIFVIVKNTPSFVGQTSEKSWKRFCGLSFCNVWWSVHSEMSTVLPLLSSITNCSLGERVSKVEQIFALN